MTIASEISRLQTAKADMKTAIVNKGVPVADSVSLSNYCDCINAIPTGGCHKIAYTIVGGGAGGAMKTGGGGGAVCVGVGGIDRTIGVSVGNGGCGYNRGMTAGGASVITGLYGVNQIFAMGGKVPTPTNCMYGGNGGVSGGGYIGGYSNCSSCGSGGGGGGGASGAGCNGNGSAGGNGGPGIMGMGGGGGGRGCAGDGQGCDGGGNGSRCCGCNATNYGGGGGGFCCVGCGGNGCQGVVILCYPKDGSFGYTGATGGTVTTCGDYMVHTFTSNGMFRVACKITEKGIYYNPYTCLISISGDGTNWITMQDRNVGATSNDITNQSSHGGLFQRGNNFGFNSSNNNNLIRTATKQNGNVNPSMYSCQCFVCGNSDWSSVQNDNLRGNTTNTCDARRGPTSCGFHVPTRNELTSLFQRFCSIKGSAITASDAQTYFCLPFAGLRGCSNGNIGSIGVGGYIRTSTPSGTSTAYYTGFNNFVGTNYRAYGYSVRAFANEPVQPDTTWCKRL